MRRVAAILGLALSAAGALHSDARSAVGKEAEFWRWFQSASARLLHFERDRERVFRELNGHLKTVNPELTFEFGPLENGRRELVISAGGIKDAFPAVEQLTAAAPVMESWKIIA